MNLLIATVLPDDNTLPRSTMHPDTKVQGIDLVFKSSTSQSDPTFVGHAWTTLIYGGLTLQPTGLATNALVPDYITYPEVMFCCLNRSEQSLVQGVACMDQTSCYTSQGQSIGLRSCIHMTMAKMNMFLHQIIKWFLLTLPGAVWSQGSQQAPLLSSKLGLELPPLC